MAYQGAPVMQRPPGMVPPAGGMYPPPQQPPSYPPPPMVMGVPPMGQHMQPGMLPPPGLPHISRPPGIPPPMMVVPPVLVSSDPAGRVPVPPSIANMKVATTVFVGNISEKASDTLIRQILLRCGPIDGWKRVQDATGKLQGFGFCEYADPDSTLRALRLLDKLQLGDKALVAKVDAKTRKDLLKYLLMKKRHKMGKAMSEAEVDKEVNKLEEDKDMATAALIVEVPEDSKSEDNHIRTSINTLLKDYRSILCSNKSNEDIQRERDVKESILFMAKQSGNIDPNSTLEDMDMEDEIKTLVSDEIKRFRESYKRSDEARKKEKSRDLARDRDLEKKELEEEKGRSKVKESDTGSDMPQAKRKRDQSPGRRNKSPVRSRSQERQEKEKRRIAMKEREKEEMLKEESEYEERVRQRRMKERERAFKQRLANWEGREYRKEKEQEKEAKREKERKEDMERERKHLGDFLAEYDDEKDDQKYYRGSAYARRRREREMEMDTDDRDRMREKDELEELRLQVIERQAREILSGDDEGDRSEEESPSRAEEEEEEEEDMDIPVKEEIEEDIPLTKSGYNEPPSYPPIQVHSAPSVDTSTGFVPVSTDTAPAAAILLRNNNLSEAKQQEQSGGNSPASHNSPSQAKLAFGLKKASATATNSSQGVATTPGQTVSTKLEKVFGAEDDEVENKPKKKLVPIEYSDEEGEQEDYSDPKKKRSHRSSGRSSSRRHHGSSSSDVGMVRGSSTLLADILEEMPKDRKLTSEERKRLTQTLVNSIPTAKEEVFEYQLKWDQIDKALIEKRVDPWINKKIAEYIGEPEPILTEFICNKLSCHISPNDILNDISMVLDDEAEVFILKLWRLLIYETEAKHLGIAKSYN